MRDGEYLSNQLLRLDQLLTTIKAVGLRPRLVKSVTSKANKVALAATATASVAPGPFVVMCELSQRAMAAAGSPLHVVLVSRLAADGFALMASGVVTGSSSGGGGGVGGSLTRALSSGSSASSGSSDGGAGAGTGAVTAAGGAGASADAGNRHATGGKSNWLTNVSRHAGASASAPATRSPRGATIRCAAGVIDVVLVLGPDRCEGKNSGR